MLARTTRNQYSVKSMVVMFLTLLIFLQSGLPDTMGFLWAGSFGSPTLAYAATDELYFIHQDHLGSTTVITDEQGDVVQQTRHYPYGSSRFTNYGLRITGNSTPITERSYTSQIKDNSTQLFYYNARYYDPELGTFTSADTAGEHFAYAGGNPVMNTDPTGHSYGDYGYSNPGTISGEEYQDSRYASSGPFIEQYDPEGNEHVYEFSEYRNLIRSDFRKFSSLFKSPIIGERLLKFFEKLPVTHYAGAIAYPEHANTALNKSADILIEGAFAMATSGDVQTTNSSWEVIEAKKIIRQKYDLPRREMRFNNPLEYERRLLEIADDAGIDVRSVTDCGSFFDEHSLAGAAYFEKTRTIAYNYSGDPVSRTGSLEHELIHGLQDIYYPGMPLNLIETEAYQAGASSSYLRDNPGGGALLDMIEMSVGIGSKVK